MTGSIPAALARCGDHARAAIVGSLPERSVRTLDASFPEWAHGGQLEPAGDWRTWVLMAGRGWGKTRAGAEWVLSVVRGGDGPAACSEGVGAGRMPAVPERIALVAASLDEARRVMVEGPSGLLSLAREGEVAEWSFGRRTLVFANGAEATLFSGTHPEGLRGPEHGFAWCDELAKWRHAGESWSNLQLGLRRGARPRALVTTTPKRGGALRAILGEAGVVVSGGASGENAHLPEGWVEAQAARIGGSWLGRQELGGELLDEAAGALWSRALIEGCRVSPSRLREGLGEGMSSLQSIDCTSPPPTPPASGRGDYARVLVGVDPPSGGGVCGIVVAGVADGIGYVIADHSAGGLSPAGWAARVAGAAEAHGADAVVAEGNQGGTMVRAVLEGAGLRLPVRMVHAREGKAVRAGPVAALFESGRARFAGTFPQLEDELAGLCADGRYEGPGTSPDRADAMVWALTKLMLEGGAEPRVRGL